MALNIKRWALNLLLSVDLTVNTVLGGAPDETMSSRLGRWKDSKSRTKRWIAAPFVWVLHKIDPGHVDKVEQYEKEIIHREEALDDKPGD